MKVVILHDWLTGFRGGERVLEAICEIYPRAPLYTLVHVPNTTSKLIESRKITTSFLNSIPGVDESYRKFLPLMPLAADCMEIIEDAELVISSSHCVIKGVKKPKNSKHLCYIHSPMRYMYDQFDNYFGKNTKLYYQIAAHLMRPYLQTWDSISNSNVDHFVANSSFVRERIQFYYQRKASVVHPFVDLKDFQFKDSKKEDFYLMVTAFAPNKRVDLAIHAFNRLGLKLKIVGSGQQLYELKTIAKSNIEFLGNLSREEILKLYNQAQAFIFPGVEDFGITPLESLASGTPVIAYAFGGVLETLNSSTAHFFHEATVESLVDAIKTFDPAKFNKKALTRRASEFSKENFQDKFKLEILKTVNR